MIKAIFILQRLSKEKIDQTIDLGANTVFTGIKNLSHESIYTIKKNNLKLFIEVGIFQSQDLWQKYPSSRPIDRKGRKIDKINWYAGVCPNNPHVRKEKLDLIKQLIKSEKIDGIWLDFIRYPCRWEEVRNSKITEYCFCSNCLNKYNKDVGGKPEGKKWINWKCKQITDFVAEVKRNIEKSKKNIRLGMFVVPWKQKEFDNAITRIIGQDFRILVKPIDVFSPMVYHKFCDRPVSWVGDTVKYFAEFSNKPILPIIQTEDEAGKLTKKVFRKEINSAIKLSSQGTIIFFLEDLLKDNRKVEIVKNTFNRLID